MFILNFLVAILPIIIIGIYIYIKDGIKESSNLLFKLFVGGIFSCLPASIIGFIFSLFFPLSEYMNIFQMFLYVFFVVALVEEFCKWFILNKISYNNKEFDSFYDMIVYGSFVALGFACFENVLYVFNFGIVTGLLRAITAVPCHVCDGIFMGYYLALAKYNQINRNFYLTKKYKLLSIVVPVIIHGIYDFCLFWATPIFIALFVFFVIVLFVRCFMKVINISKNNVKFFNEDSCDEKVEKNKL